MEVRILQVLTMITLLIGVEGCAITHTRTDGGSESMVAQKKQQVTKNRGAVLLPRDFSEEGYDEYIPALVRVLKRHGFTPVATGKARYSTSFYLGGGFGMESTITLYDNGIPIITGKSSNPGFGTWIARPIVSESLFQASLEKFDKELYRLDG